MCVCLCVCVCVCEETLPGNGVVLRTIDCRESFFLITKVSGVVQAPGLKGVEWHCNNTAL